jgi:hypothetical protein
MSLSEDDIERLKDVARQATALVIVDDRPVGAAFFITDDLLLTCEHVATYKHVTIKPNGRPYRTAEVIGTDGADLALLSTHQVEGEQPVCAVLDQTLHQGPCFVAGFPSEHNVAPGSVVFDVQTYLRKDLEGGVQILEIAAGKIIGVGMSGGPVVSARSGAVIGIIRTSRNPDDALGGGAIPVSRAAEAFEQVAEILPKSILAMASWRGALGRDNWQRLGKSWNLEEYIDLKVSGKRNRWLIGMDQAGPGLDLASRGLGEEISEAIFHWSRRRHARGAEEVALLGRLLSGALFSQSNVDHLSSVSQADSIFVRLHVERGNDLSEIPWELAAIPREKNRFLAADQKFRFARVVDNPAVATTPAAPKPPENVQVLAVVARPEHWKYPEVHRPYGKPYEWPKADVIYDRLRNSIERPKFQPVRPKSPQPSDVRGAIEDGARHGRPCDVLHYIGIGQRGADGQAQIMFVDDEGDESWEDVRSILEPAARADVRLVVLELMQPPEGLDYEPLTHHALYDAVGGSVNDVVLTHLPVHPKQCQKFNDKFYEVLGSGESIETAVQLARYKLMYDRPMDDASGFGWFTVITGPQSGICLVSLRPEDPMMGGMPHLDTADRAVDATGEAPGQADW